MDKNIIWVTVFNAHTFEPIKIKLYILTRPYIPYSHGRFIRYPKAFKLNG